jgi:hypothetical protein
VTISASGEHSPLPGPAGHAFGLATVKRLFAGAGVVAASVALGLIIGSPYGMDRTLDLTRDALLRRADYQLAEFWHSKYLADVRRDIPVLASADAASLDAAARYTCVAHGDVRRADFAGQWAAGSDLVRRGLVPDRHVAAAYQLVKLAGGIC